MEEYIPSIDPITEIPGTGSHSFTVTINEDMFSNSDILTSEDRFIWNSVLSLDDIRDNEELSKISVLLNPHKKPALKVVSCGLYKEEFGVYPSYDTSRGNVGIWEQVQSSFTTSTSFQFIDMSGNIPEETVSILSQSVSELEEEDIEVFRRLEESDE